MLLKGVARHLVGEVLRDDHHRLAVADNDIARIDRHAGAGDGQVDVHRVVVDKADRRGR